LSYGALAKGVVTIEILGTGAGKIRERITREGYPGFVAERYVEADFNPTRFQTPVGFPGGYQLWEIAPYFPPGTELAAGKQLGSIDGKFLITGMGERSLVSQARVAGQEKVRVPSGEFTAWRVETVSGSAFGSEKPAITCTFWYSPEHLRTVKMQCETKGSTTPGLNRETDKETYELLRFDSVR
jgi:hypothetical protein